ncbi:hypothetical protein ABPG75_011960 [Micractinium tetrahymenae]
MPPFSHSSKLTSTAGTASSPYSKSNDLLLSYITTKLATMPQPQPPRALSAGSAGGGGGGSSSNGRALPEDMQRWVVRWDELQLEAPIGQGSFGWVYKGVWNETQVAVKVLIQSGQVEEGGGIELPDEVMQELLEEAVVMSHIRSSHCVNFLGICMVPPCIVLEYCAQGSLFGLLHRARHEPDLARQLSWSRRLQMALDAATGMLYLHRRTPPIIHCDLKSPNLLVDENWRVKVTDFNLSKTVKPAGEASVGEVASNPLWLAPEIFRGEKPTAASDVFAFAVVCYELLTWRLPWAGETLFKIPRRMLSGERPAIPPPAELPGADAGPLVGLETYIALIQKCWAAEPGDRPTFAEIVPKLRELVNAAGQQLAGLWRLPRATVFCVSLWQAFDWHVRGRR